jgi:glycogen debranching enzyme
VPKPFAQHQIHYILASPETPRETELVLKHDDVFGVFDRFGDIDSSERRSDGVYFQGTRFLSRSQLRFAGSRPLLLSSAVRQDNIVLAVDLTNPDLHQTNHGMFMPRGSLHIYRAQFLWQDTLHQRIQVRNFSGEGIEVRLSLIFGADFADIFEVRGTPREHSGKLMPARREGDALLIEYHGLDGVVRRTVIRSLTHPRAIAPDGVSWVEELEPGADTALEVTLAFERESKSSTPKDYDSSLSKATSHFDERASECSIWTSSEQFNAWFRRSEADLRMLSTQMGDGTYPYAGIPWFSTPFGRDGILTALECLWMNPSLARGVLRYLTRTQAQTSSARQDAEPGKIIHEARECEMAVLGEVPFHRYYGSVDATPLYLLLASEYFRRTEDKELLREIWPAIERALGWLNGDGDIDQDGFVEYHRKAKGGLIQQGWKDSEDSIFHRDGTLAQPPIALAEVQAYVFGAKIGLSRVAVALGYHAEAEKLLTEAKQLQGRYEEHFWSPSLDTYAIALDGEKRRCDVRSSNAGHALFCGIAGGERAHSVARGFLTEHFHSGWGIRTIAEGEARYNPMSYHNGSIWPHDNALIAAGMSRYGFTSLASQVMAGLFQAATCLELNRLPELFCGFRRRAGKMPTWYPTACSPQAWSAASAFLLLQSSIGLSIDGFTRSVTLQYPVLPDFLETVYIRNLRVGDASIDLRLFRSGSSVAATVERRTGALDVIVLA